MKLWADYGALVLHELTLHSKFLSLVYIASISDNKTFVLARGMYSLP